MADTVDGSVPAMVIIAERSSGSGRPPPLVTSICCIAICPRAPTARASASPCACTVWSSASTRPVIAVSAVSNNGA